MGRQEEEVSSPKVPCYVVVQKSSKKSIGDSYSNIAARRLGKIHILCGAVAFFCGSCLLVNSVGPWSFIDRVGAGLWCGIIFFLAGIFNIITAKYRSNTLIIANIVIGIVAALFAVALVTVGSIGLLEARYDYVGSEDEKSYGFNILQLITGLVEIILGITSSSLSCKATCCRESENTTSVRSEVMFSQAGGLDQAQIINLANEIQERRVFEHDEVFHQPPPYDDVALV